MARQGQIVAGERYFNIDGQLVEIKRQLRLRRGYPFDPDKLSAALQDVIEGHFPTHEYEVYRTPPQVEGYSIPGIEVEEWLENRREIQRVLSYKDAVVRGWLGHHATYPKRLKDCVAWLWGTKRPGPNAAGTPIVSCLGWRSGSIQTGFRGIYELWGPKDVILLRSQD